MKKAIFITISIIILALVMGGLYYWFFVRETAPVQITPTTNNTLVRGFNPFNREPQVSTPNPVDTNVSTSSDTQTDTNIPALRLRKISDAPVGGMSASSTVLRYIDRGLGHIFETLSTSTVAEKISNTTIPRVYESYWNKNLNQVVLRSLKSNSDTVVNFFGEIKPIKVASGTPESTTRYEVKGRFMSSEIKNVAVSPKGDKIFTFNIENGRGIGYISNFDESRRIKLFDTPITQVNVDWPEENTITLTTNASSASYGYLYFVDVRNGNMKKIMSGKGGFTAKVSRDAKKILYTASVPNSIKTFVYDTVKNKTLEVIFSTLVEKCAWSSIRKNEVYCAVPTSYPEGMYPDDWYKGKISFTDEIWNLNTDTGDVHLLVNPLKESSALVDGVNLLLDPKDNFLYFINKNDLSLWSLDLNK